jgi:hypothetical protein
VEISSIMGRALVSSTTTGFILIYPSGVISGRFDCGTAFGPMCLFELADMENRVYINQSRELNPISYWTNSLQDLEGDIVLCC